MDSSLQVSTCLVNLPSDFWGGSGDAEVGCHLIPNQNFHCDSALIPNGLDPGDIYTWLSVQACTLSHLEICMKSALALVWLIADCSSASRYQICLREYALRETWEN